MPRLKLGMPVFHSEIQKAFCKDCKMYCKTIGCCSGVSRERWNIGMRLCMLCADKRAKKVRHTIVPMPKSNYIVVTDKSLLVGLNSSHKGK